MKKQLKKVISALLVMALIVTMFTSVYAAGTNIYLTSAENGDNTYKVTVCINGNTGFSAFNLTLNYDKYVVSPVKFNKSELTKDFNITTNLDDSSRDSEKRDSISFAAYSIDSEQKSDGELFTVIFKFKDAIPADKQSKETVISVDKDSLDACDSKYANLSITVGDSAKLTAPETEREPAEGEYDEPKKDESGSNTNINEDAKDSIISSLTGKDDYKAEITTVDGQSKVKYMTLYSDNTFKPDQAATRYEVIEALSNLIDIKAEKYADALSDVDDQHKDIVSKFITAKILSGYEDKTFKGNNTITRAEFVKILSIAFKMDVKDSAKATFTDTNGHWAEKYIASFAESGYTKGYEEADKTFTFRPENQVTRAEVVSFINRIIKADGDKTEGKATDIKDHWACEQIEKVIK